MLVLVQVCYIVCYYIIVSCAGPLVATAVLRPPKQNFQIIVVAALQIVIIHITLIIIRNSNDNNNAINISISVDSSLGVN